MLEPQHDEQIETAKPNGKAKPNGRVRVKANNDERNQWVLNINATWQSQVPSIIETGKLLQQAKSALGHGGWGSMFKGEGKLTFSQNTAGKLIKIGKHERISEHAQNLPPHWDTLYELTRLTDKEWDDAIKRNDIKPEMSREQAKALLHPLDIVPAVIKGLVDAARKFPSPTTDLAHRMDTEAWNLTSEELGGLGKLSKWCDELSDVYEARKKKKDQERAARVEAGSGTRAA